MVFKLFISNTTKCMLKFNLFSNHGYGFQIDSWNAVRYIDIMILGPAVPPTDRNG